MDGEKKLKLFLVWHYREGVLLTSAMPKVVEAESAESAAAEFYNGAIVVEAQAFGIAAEGR